MPARGELKPRGMLEFLTYVNVVEVRTDCDSALVEYEVALQATHARNVFGPLAHGKLETGLSEVTARRRRYCFDLVTNSARSVRISARVTGGGKFWLDSECLLAPLGNDPERVTAIMWVFASWEAGAA